MDNTCTCISHSGSMLRIKTHDFYKRIQTRESWRMYKQECLTKRSFRTERFDSINKFEKDMIAIKTKSQIIYIPEQADRTQRSPPAQRRTFDHTEEVAAYILKPRPELQRKPRPSLLIPITSRASHSRQNSPNSQTYDKQVLSLDVSKSLVSTPMVKKISDQSFRNHRVLVEPLSQHNRVKSLAVNSSIPDIRTLQNENREAKDLQKISAFLSPLSRAGKSRKSTSTRVSKILSASMDTGMTIAGLVPIKTQTLKPRKNMLRSRLFRNIEKKNSAVNVFS